MKQLITHLCTISLVASLFLTGCQQEGAELRPGLYLDTEAIYAFAGKEVKISGQASCYTGINSVAFRCEKWGINDVTDLSWQKPVVWNFDYTLKVPQNADFPQNLIITVTDVNGSEMKKTLRIDYAPATTAPYVEGLRKQIAVEYADDATTATSDVALVLYGEDNLRYAVVQIPDLTIRDTITLSAKEEKLRLVYDFAAQAKTYPMSITLCDQSGNITLSESEIVVMPKEKQDELKDHEYLLVFKSNLNESDYLYGYYQYVERKDAFGYEVNVYAESDETEFFFTTEHNTDGTYKFGLSPYISDRIISTQSYDKNYVKPFRPGKGYWGLYINLKDNYIEKWEYVPSQATTSTLYIASDNGVFVAGAQFAKETSRENYIHQFDYTLKAVHSSKWFLFADKDYWGWAPNNTFVRYWRPWDAGGEIGGWWTDINSEGGSGNLPNVQEDTDVSICFDTAIPWCWIKKKVES